MRQNNKYNAPITNNPWNKHLEIICLYLLTCLCYEIHPVEQVHEPPAAGHGGRVGLKQELANTLQIEQNINLNNCRNTRRYSYLDIDYKILFPVKISLYIKSKHLPVLLGKLALQFDHIVI